MTFVKLEPTKVGERAGTLAQPIISLTGVQRNLPAPRPQPLLTWLIQEVQNFSQMMLMDQIPQRLPTPKEAQAGSTN